MTTPHDARKLPMPSTAAAAFAAAFYGHAAPPPPFVALPPPLATAAALQQFAQLHATLRLQQHAAAAAAAAAVGVSSSVLRSTSDARLNPRQTSSPTLFKLAASSSPSSSLSSLEGKLSPKENRRDTRLTTVDAIGPPQHSPSAIKRRSTPTTVAAKTCASPTVPRIFDSEKTPASSSAPAIADFRRVESLIVRSPLAELAPRANARRSATRRAPPQNSPPAASPITAAPPPPTNSARACPICQKQFTRHWLLQGHIRTHTGERPFKCDMCSKAFADKSNLRAHVQTHSGIKNHVCGRCGKRFALRSYLSKHEESSCNPRHHRSFVSNPPAAFYFH